MAIKLLRESSDTPNISNKDDVRMIRYAYGGYNGVIQKYGEEFSYTSGSSYFRIKSGRAVVDGWEVDIDGAGVQLTLENSSSRRYYTVYLEVNAELETAEIKFLYDTATHPTITHGDDLTEIQSGIARIILYQFTLYAGLVSSVYKVFTLIKYGKSLHDDMFTELEAVRGTALDLHNENYAEIQSIKYRLDQLGFREGVATVNVASTARNSLKRQGNYVIFNLSLNGALVPAAGLQITIPKGFRPKSSVEFIGLNSSDSKGDKCYVMQNGTVEFSFFRPDSSFQMLNVGWETADT